MATSRTVRVGDGLIQASLTRGASMLSLLPLYADIYLKSAGGRPTFKDKDRRVFRNLNFPDTIWANLKWLAKNVSQFTRYKVSPAQLVAMLMEMEMMSKKETAKIAREVSKKNRPNKGVF